MKFKIPFLLNEICSSSYYYKIKDKITNFFLSKNIYKYLDNKEYFVNITYFSIFTLPILKFIVLGYKNISQ